MGRNRKPIERHLLDGTYRADRHGPIPPHLANSRGVIVGGTGPIETPAGFAMGDQPAKPASLSAAASAFWDHVVRTRAGVLRASDASTLAILAEWHANWLRTLADLDTATGGPARLKLTQQLSICSTNFERLGRKFGLTPSDRATVPAPHAGGPEKPRVATRQPTKLDRSGPPAK